MKNSRSRLTLTSIVLSCLGLLIWAGAASAQIPFACTGEAFIVQNINAELSQVDQSVSPFEFLGIGPPAGTEYNNLGFRRTDGLLYAVELNTSGNTQIIQIDSTGAVFGLGRPAGLPTGPRFDGGDVTPDGTTMYIQTVNSDLFVLDLTNVPTLPPVTAINVTGAAGFVFDYAVNPTNGLLYGGDSTAGQLAVLDPGTGVRTDFAVGGCSPVTPDCTATSLPSGTAYGGAWFNAAGRLFLYRNNGVIFEIDLSGPTIVRTQTGPGSSRNDGAACVQDVIGAAKQMSATMDGIPETFTIDYVFENLSGSEDLFSVSAIDDLTLAFGTHGTDWSFTSISSVPASFANPTFDGHTDTELVNQLPTQDLLAGSLATMTVTLEIFNLDNLIDGQFCNQVLATALTIGGNTIGDLSNDSNDTDPNGDGSPDERSPTCVPFTPTPGIQLVKTGVQDPTVVGDPGITEVGDTIEYTFEVTNTGDVSLSDVTVTDPMVLPITCPSGNPIPSLAVGASETCTGTYTVTQADIDAGQKDNTATATGDDPNGDPVSDDDSHSEPIVQVPALDLVKSAAPATYDTVGQIISYSYLVTNTGNVVIDNLTVADDNDDEPPGVVCPVTTLAPAASTTCTAQRTVTQADIDAGSITNIAVASGTDPDSNPVDSPPDSETVTTNISNPAIQLIKTGALDVGGNGQSNPGDVINYSFEVTNTGDVVLTNVTVTDPMVSPITCPSGNPIALLGVGASETCTGVYTITQADIDAGQKDNTATATGDDPDGDPVSDMDTHTEPIPPTVPQEAPCTGEAFIVQNVNAQLTQVDQSTQPFTFVNVGVPAGTEYNNLGFRRTDGLLYAVELNAGGNTQIIQIDRNGNVFGLGRPAGLPAGPRFDGGDVSTDGTTMYITTVNQDLYLLDLTTVPTLPPVSVVNITGDGGFVFDWAYNPIDGLLYGGDSTAGQLAILDPATGVRTDVNLIDTGLGTLPSGTAFGGSWFNAAGQLFIYRNNGEIYEIDLSVPTIVDIQTGPGSTRNDGASCVQDQVGSAKRMTATTDGLPETVTIDYVFENISATEDLFNLAATDDLTISFGTHGVDWTFTSISSVPASFANPTFDGHLDTELVNQVPTQSLLTGGVATVTVTLEILTFDGLNADSEFCNQILMTGETAAGILFGDLSTDGIDPDPDGDGSPDERELACVGFTPPADSMSLVKSLQSNADEDASGTVTEGDTLTYSFVATNTGASTLTNVTITDPLPGLSALSCTPSQPATLAPAATLSCTATYTVTAADATAGVINNTATASSDQTPDDQDSETVPVDTPAISSMNLVKSLQSNADEDGSGDVTENDTLTYSFVVTNTGATTLTGVSVADPLPGLGTLSCTPTQPATLAPAATLSCTATYVVTAADVAAGAINNTATASSNETPDDQDTETVPVIGGPVPLPCSGEAFIVQNLDAELIQVDQSVSPFVFIPVSGPTGIEINNLAFRSTDGLLYGVELNASGNTQIVQIDANGDVFGLGRPAGLPPSLRFDGGDISTDGDTFYLNRSGSGFLYRVDLPSFTFTVVPILGATGIVFDWAVNPTNGLLYGGDHSNGQLAILDPATGSRTDVNLVDTGNGTLPTGTSYGGAWFNANGQLFLYRNNGTIYEIDLSVPTIVDIQTGPGSSRNDAAACVQNALGAAKQMATTNDGLPETVTIDYVFENLGVIDDLFNLSATEDLAAVFGTQGVDWTFTSISSVPASFANPSFDGDVETEMINQAPTQSLLTGSLATIQVQLELLTLAAIDPSNQFCNQIEVTGENAAGTIFGDLSTDGTDPDPDGNGSPDERELACITLTPQPSMSLVKSLQSNADEDGSSDVSVGDTLTYSFVVTNTGQATLTGVTIVDPLPGLSALSCTPTQPATLAPGATLSCTATYTVTLADVATGVINNTATASSNETPDDQDTETVPIGNPSMNLVKSLQSNADEDGSGDVSENDTLTYSFVVTNTGTTNLTNVTITDPLPGLSALTCIPTQPAALGPGAVMSCTATYVVTAADVTIGSIVNTATASSDQTPDDQDSEIVPTGPVPPGGPVPIPCTGEAFIVQDINAQLTQIDQSVSPFTFITIGVPTGIEINNLAFRSSNGLLYAVELTGTGNNGLIQIDNNGDVFNIGSPTGLPTTIRFDAGDITDDGGTMFLNQSGTGTLYHVDLTAFSTTSVAITGGTGLVFDWAYNPNDGLLYGGDSTGGQMAILDPATGVRTDVNLVDTGNGVLPSGTAFGGAWFDATGRLFLYQNNGFIFEVDLAVPTIINVQDGPGSTRNDAAACIQDAIGSAKLMTITNTGFPETVTIDYVFENFSAVNNLSIVSGLDDLAPIFGTFGTDWSFLSISSVPATFANPFFNGATNIELINQTPTQSLPPLAVFTVSVEIQVFNFDNLANGQFCNQVVVTAVSPDGVTVGDLSTQGTDPDPNGDGSPDERELACMDLVQAPAIQLIKTGTLDLGGNGIANPGDLIDYNFDVTNTGNVTLSNVTVTDPMVAPITCPSGNPIPSLAVGATETCTGSYAITQADIDAGQKDNTATASGQDPDGDPVSDDDTHTEPIPSPAAIQLVKMGSLDVGGDGIATPGDLINYTFEVFNTGAVTLTNITVSDPLVSPIDCSGITTPPQIAILTVGASTTCTGSYAITQADIDAMQVVNTATATGEDPNGDPVSDDDTHTEPVGVTPLTAFPCTGEAYIVQNINAQLSEIDQTTDPFTFQSIGGPAGIEYNNLGFRSDDGLLYAVELNASGNTQIVQIDATGTVNGLGRPAGLPTGPRFDAGDVSSDGDTMFITTVNRDLYLLDLTSVPVLPPVTQVPVTGDSGFVFDWTFNPTNGLLYGGDSSNGQMAILDPATGIRTDVNLVDTGNGTLPSGTAYGGAWFDASGRLFLYRNNGRIFEVDLSVPTIVDVRNGPSSTRNDAAACIQSVIGGAKNMTASGGGLPETITIDYVFENFSGTVDLFDLSAIDDLIPVFGTPGVDWTFTSISSVPTSFANPAFDGENDVELINQTPTQSLLAGAIATIQVQVEVLTTNAVNADGQFCNLALITAVNSVGTIFGDQSTAGSDPDPNGDGSPDEREPACVSPGQTTFTCTGEAYIIQNVDAELTLVNQSVDPFVFVPVSGPTGLEINNLGLRRTDGLMYAVELETRGNTQIVQIDASGNVVGLGRPAGLPTRPRFDAGDISSDGSTMYITTNNQDLYILDLTMVPTLPPVTSVNITGGVGFVFDWAYNPADGLLYGGDSSGGQLAVLDPATGIRIDTPLVGLPPGVAYGGAWFGNNGNLFLFRNSGTIFEIDVSGVLPVVVGSQNGPGSTRNDAASCVP